MDRLGRDIRYRAQRYWWLLTAWAAAAAYLLGAGWLPPWLLLLLAPPLLVFLTWPNLAAMVRLVAAVRRFDVWNGRRVSIVRDPQRLDEAACQELETRIGPVLDELAERFGRPLKEPIYLNLLPAEELEALRGEPLRGLASGRRMITLAEERLDDPDGAEETLRHEIAHLFAAGCGSYRPKLKGEGLAVYLQKTRDGQPLDSQALAALLGARSLPLPWLIDDDTFATGAGYSYSLAGSFTGFLVERCGWDRFLAFYRAARPSDFEAQFERCFEMTLLDAERDWRQALLDRRPQFEPEVTDEIERNRARTACEAFNYHTALELTRGLIERGAATGDDWELAGLVLMMQAEFGAAAAHYRAALETDREPPRQHRAYRWFRIGALHDLQGEREVAVEAYQQALRKADDRTDGASSHDRARRRLEQPYSLEDYRKQMLGLD